MYFRVKAKSKPPQTGGIRGAALFLSAFVIGYCLMVPDGSGAVGRAVAKVLFVIMGKAALLIPIALAWMGKMQFSPESSARWRLDTLWNSLLLMDAAALLSIAGTVHFQSNYGGWIGLKLNPFFTRLFGPWLSLIILALCAAWLVSRLLRISLRLLMSVAWSKLIEDYRIWQDARAELKKTPAGSRPRLAQRVPQVKSDRADAPRSDPAPRIVTPPAPAPAAMPAPVPPKRDTKSPAASRAAAAAAQTPFLPLTYDYKLPPIELLSDDKIPPSAQNNDEHLANAALLTKTLSDFNIEAKVKEIIPGPVVTRYDIELAPGVKFQTVTSITDNIALAMKSPAIRIIPVPEKSAVGVEVPNSQSCVVGLKSILACAEFQNSRSLLALALGKTTDGLSYTDDLASMPHLLIAGATGSGKSVGIHSLILSILYRARPDQVKFMLIDPKRVEMPAYRGLPHLYDPRVPAEKADIITQPKDASDSLKKLVRVMEMRYEKFAKETVRNIEAYNEKMAEIGGQKEFYIVVIIDELADLMMIASKEIEDAIQRLAQMARAVGIHLILATQRPSVNVITGVIKANFPARIAFQTTSKVDSRVILDAIGADSLLGRGDMLFLPPGESRPVRLQGAFISAKETEKVIEFIRNQNIPCQYEDLSRKITAEVGQDESGPGGKGNDELVQALRLVVERRRVSQDLLKAHFGSSARATNLLSMLETSGFINKPEGTNRWTIYFDKITEYLNAAGAPPQE